MNRSRHASAIILGLASAALVPAARADVIISGPVVARTQDAPAVGTGDGADVGTGVFSGAGDAIIVGDSSNNLQEYRPVFEFDISGATAEILGAPLIQFSITANRLGSTTTNPLGSLGQFVLVALSADEDGSVGNDDYSAAGAVVATFDAADFNNGVALVADVTSYVKADALAAQQWSGFRLQAINPDSFNDNDGVADALFFGTIGNNDASLTVVPEPGAIVLASLGGVALLARRGRD